MANTAHSQRQRQQQQQQPFVWRSERIRLSSDSQPSRSEYHESEKSIDMDIQNPQVADSPQFTTRVTSHGRRVLQKNYIESDEDPTAFNDDVESQALPDTQLNDNDDDDNDDDDNDDDDNDDDDDDDDDNDDDDDDDDEQPVQRHLRTRSQSKQNVVHESDKELKPGPS
jgi:hypothetical protein